MPTASRGEPEIKNWTFGVVTHIIITLSNMKSRYNYVATVVTESLKLKASSIAGVNREQIVAEPES